MRLPSSLTRMHTKEANPTPSLPVAGGIFFDDTGCRRNLFRVRAAGCALLWGSRGATSAAEFPRWNLDTLPRGCAYAQWNEDGITELNHRQFLPHWSVTALPSEAPAGQTGPRWGLGFQTRPKPGPGNGRPEHRPGDTTKLTCFDTGSIAACRLVLVRVLPYRHDQTAQFSQSVQSSPESALTTGHIQFSQFSPESALTAGHIQICQFSSVLSRP
eukprot:gene268-biopygen2467